MVADSLFAQAAKIFEKLPHCATLGMRFVGTEPHYKPIIAIDWADHLVGDTITGVIHGGVITSLIDTCSALSVVARLEHAESLATLDLRIDYASSAIKGETILCQAECYRLSQNIAFTRAICYHESNSNNPIAHGVATFMRNANTGALLRK
jgi:uncharacterized protein (TIGR00369 family)